MNDKNLHYCHLAHPVFSDMMFASTVFGRGNRCAQVYATDFGWARAFSMTSRSETHDTLLLLFVRDGVCQLVYTTMPKRWYKVTSTILPGQMLQKEI